MTGNPDVALQGARERVDNFFEELAGYAKAVSSKTGRARLQVWMTNLLAHLSRCLGSTHD
jgi:hypothetical protein